MLPTDAPARRFVDQMGVAAEHDGLPRIAGRLFGALLLSEEPRSLDDLAAQLGASKASVSTDARRLLDRGIVERHARRGDRRDYYALAPDFFERLIRHRLGRWNNNRGLVADLSRGALAPAARRRAEYVEAFHAFVLARIDEALHEWEAMEHPPRAARASRKPRTGSAA
jgi:DNA-binding MarR family transcriptional regulator